VPLERKDLQIFRECKFVAGKSKYNYQIPFLEKKILGMK
jgi:hypothetical protein